MTTDELIKKLRDNVACGYAGDLMLKAADRLEATVDAVPVVRCKDCEEYKDWDGSKICMRFGSYYGNMKPDDYCSKGRRRSE